jgi:HlyD family secretion protein
MDKKIFPFQMVNPSVEALHARHSKRSTVIYWTILLTLLGFFFSMPFIEVEVNTRSRGMIRSDLANNQLVAAASGQVRAVYIKDNQAVSVGDTLLILNSSSLQEQISFTQKRLNETNQLQFDFQKLTLYGGRKTPVLNSVIAQRELNQYLQKRAEYELRLQHASQQLERQNQLLASGNVAKINQEQAQHDLQLVQNSLDLLNEQYQRNWAQEKQRYHNESQELNTQLQKLIQDQDNYVIKAAIAGNITQFTDVRPGNFIGVGQVVGEISASDELLVETYVTPSDIGLLRKDLPVQFQIDAFNSQQWGLAHGRIVEIAKDIVIIQDMPVFLVKCSLEQNSLYLKNGYRGRFQKGMTLTSHFSVAKRTLYDLLYDKVDDWLDPYQG